jgi:hypothetical protein
MVSNDFKQWGGRSYRPRRTEALRATMSGAKAVTQLLAEAGATISLWRLASVNPVVAEPVIGPHHFRPDGLASSGCEL